MYVIKTILKCLCKTKITLNGLAANAYIVVFLPSVLSWIENSVIPLTPGF